jgi:hypothetical protein
MFTADKARKASVDQLDERIRREVNQSISDGLTHGYLRIYIEDWFFDSIEEELTKRGYHSIEVPRIVLKGDVYFSWAEHEETDD